ncbi:putative MFS transmembrane transport protein [Rhodotorula sp. JG-1b]|nr:putative MFS transmembrane transport protein [Rhodotorula sp. JG-1b]
MPAFKETSIHSSFFPEAGDNERVERGSDDTHEKGDANEKGAQGPARSNNPADFGNDKIVLVQFEDGDPENPLNWSKSKKWVITILLDAMTVAIGLSTTAYSSGISRMTEEFGVANVVGQLGLTTFNCACAIAPLFLAPFCELVGRREVFLSAYFGFTVIFILIADAPNIGAVLAGRLLSGIFGSCGTILVGGTLADIWNTRDRGIPMSTFTFAAIFGTIFAPVYSGPVPFSQFIDQSIGWRWLQWIHMIANGVLLVLEIIFLRETRGAKILARRAKKLRKETGKNNIRAPVELENESVKDLLRTACTRSISLLVREPVVLAFGLWIAFAWGVTFLFLSAIPLCFQNNHGWSEGIAGLPYLALVAGCFIGFGTSRWSDIVYDRKRDSNNGIPVPEYRLIGAMAFAWLLPAGLFIFSFTQYGFITPVAPIISLICILEWNNSYHVFNTVYNYTSDAYPDYASSAIAGQGLLRNMFGGVTPLFANQMFNGMGYQYAGLLLSLVATLAAPLPFILFKYGERIRAKSKYASSDDELEKERITDDNVNDRGVPSTEAQYTSSFAV